MIDRIFTSPTQLLLNKGLDVLALRNMAIANNIANVDTPGYKRREIIFEENIKKVLEKKQINDKLYLNNSRHMQILEQTSRIEPELRIVNETSYRNDGNNVDIDVETAKLAKNKLAYDALGRSMSNELRLLRIAITGRS
ncbi:MAG: flagellar basal body rod protein FlgB [Syntrophomonadaceae bacterium]